MKCIGLVFVALLLTVSSSTSQPKLKKKRNWMINGKEVFHVLASDHSVKHGEYLYKANGKKVLFEGLYKHNKRHGQWVFQYPNGIQIKAYYKNGDKDSVWVYYRNGKIISKLHFDRNRLNGKTLSYYGNGDILVEEFYENGKITETRKIYYRNGKTKIQVDYKEPGIVKKYKIYDPTGELITHIIYKDGYPFSIEKNIAPDSLRYFSGDLQNGNGNLKIYQKSKISENPIMKSSQNFTNGKLDGKYLKYHINGEFDYNGFYKHNFLVGQWLFYDVRTGNISKVKEYAINDSIKTDTIQNFIIKPEFEPGISIAKFNNNIISKFRTLVMQNVEIPHDVMEDEINGTVFVQMTVDLTGERVDIKRLNSINESLDKEVERVFNNLPPLSPIFENNIPKKIDFTMPFVVRIKKARYPASY